MFRSTIKRVIKSTSHEVSKSSSTQCEDTQVNVDDERDFGKNKGSPSQKSSSLWRGWVLVLCAVLVPTRHRSQYSPDGQHWEFWFGFWSALVPMVIFFLPLQWLCYFDTIKSMTHFDLNKSMFCFVFDEHRLHRRTLFVVPCLQKNKCITAVVR